MTKIKAMSDFITKITRKNILFIATILFINYQLIATWSNIPINKFSFNMYLSVKIYTLITLCSLIILNILFYMKKNYDVILINKYKNNGGFYDSNKITQFYGKSLIR